METGRRQTGNGGHKGGGQSGGGQLGVPHKGGQIRSGHTSYDKFTRLAETRLAQNTSNYIQLY